MCYFIYFSRKIKYIDYNLIDYYLRQYICDNTFVQVETGLFIIIKQ